MIKSLIKFLQKFDRETYTDDKKLPDPNNIKNKVEPKIEITGFEVNPENPSEGAFSFDWNAEFIQTLRQQGYEGKKDEDLVDQWFSDICKNVVLETYEQEKARLDNLPDNPNLIRRKGLGGNRNEYS